MCVINLGKVEKRVIAWKLLRRWKRELYPLVRSGLYRVNKIYEAPENTPGFQAFVNKSDAVNSFPKWNHVQFVLRKVILYEARQGIIERMDAFSNGKRGWTARRMKILPLRKSK